MRFTVLLALAASAVAQAPAALHLSTSTATVDANLVLFQVDVLTPGGVWLEDSNAAGEWSYSMEAQWMSRIDDQQPIQSGRWSLPEVNVGINSWHYGPAVLLQRQHLRSGSYLMAMADDSDDAFPNPNPVVPVASPTTFSDGCVSITAIGYANVAGVNAALTRPPWSASLPHLQPCDMTGDFPYTVYAASPPVTITWEAGAHVDTCSGFAYGLPPIGFIGACSRWIAFNFAASSSHAAAVDILFFRQLLAIGPGTRLPDAVAGAAFLGLDSGPPAVVDLDVEALTGIAAGGGRLRYLNLPAIAALAIPNGQNMELQFNIGPDPTLIGVSMLMQAVALDAGFGINVTDLYSITFW